MKTLTIIGIITCFISAIMSYIEGDITECFGWISGTAWAFNSYIIQIQLKKYE